MAYEIRVYQPVGFETNLKWCADVYERIELADGANLVRVYESAALDNVGSVIREAAQEIEKYTARRSAAHASL